MSSLHKHKSRLGTLRSLLLTPICLKQHLKEVTNRDNLLKRYKVQYQSQDQALQKNQSRRQLRPIFPRKQLLTKETVLLRNQRCMKTNRSSSNLLTIKRKDRLTYQNTWLRKNNQLVEQVDRNWTSLSTLKSHHQRKSSKTRCKWRSNLGCRMRT